MKTKQIPAIIMLIAGLVTSIAAILSRMETVQFLKILVVVLIIFYVLGCIVKVIFDRNFKEEVEEAGSETEAEENQMSVEENEEVQTEE